MTLPRRPATCSPPQPCAAWWFSLGFNSIAMPGRRQFNCYAAIDAHLERRPAHTQSVELRLAPWVAACLLCLPAKRVWGIRLGGGRQGSTWRRGHGRARCAFPDRSSVMHYRLKQTRQCLHERRSADPRRILYLIKARRGAPLGLAACGVPGGATKSAGRRGERAALTRR